MKNKENFESNLEKLEQLTADIKRTDISLEEALKDFEEGIKIAKGMEKVLNEIEGKVQILMNDPKSNDEDDDEDDEDENDDDDEDEDESSKSCNNKKNIDFSVGITEEEEKQMNSITFEMLEVADESLAQKAIDRRANKKQEYKEARASGKSSKTKTKKNDDEQNKNGPLFEIFEDDGEINGTRK